METTFSTWGVLKESYDIVKSNFFKIIGGYALLIIFFLSFDIVLGQILILEIIISALFSFCSVLFALAYIGGGTFSLDAILLKLTFRKFLSYLLAYVFVGLAIVGGCIFLIVPGILVAVQLRMVKFIAFEKDIKPREALRESVRITKGYRFKILEYMVISLLVNALGALFLVIGLFFTMPLTIIGLGLIYKKLCAKTESQPVVQATEVIDAEVLA